MINLTTKGLPLQQFSYSVIEEGYFYISVNRLFFAYYSSIPNIKSISRINCTKFRKAIELNKKNCVITKHYRQKFERSKNLMCYLDLMYLMSDGTIVSLENDTCRVSFAPENEQKAEEWISYAKSFTKSSTKKTNELRLVIQDTQGLKSIPIKIKKPKLNIATHYNDDMAQIHESIVKKLRQKVANGLFLFYGNPGTGKSTYIKYLIHALNKDVIFMSPKLAGSLDSPELMSFLINSKNAIIVVEDAEELITSRAGGRNSSISTLLNLTDGLLVECLNIQIIATFNTQIVDIDKALLRKGRLQALYEFKELSIPKSNALLQQLGINDYRTSKAMTLAEIHNFKETDHTHMKERVQIGFVKQTA